MPSLDRTVALAGLLVSGVLGMAPMSAHVNIETAPPQEIGTMTSDGLFVYSMNYCTIVQTTSCSVSVSTGGPVPEPSTEGISTPYESAPGTPAYPAPSGEPSEPSEPSEATTPSSAPTSTPDVEPTETGPEESPSGTSTGPATGTETGGASDTDAWAHAVLAGAGMALAYLF